MRKYEAYVLIKPTLEPTQALEVSNKFLELIKLNGGEVEAKNSLEKTKKTPFEVKGHNAAYEQVFDFEAEPEFIFELERNLKIDENIIRFLTLKIDDKKIAAKKKKAEKKAKKDQAKKAAEAKKEETKAEENKEEK